MTRKFKIWTLFGFWLGFEGLWGAETILDRVPSEKQELQLQIPAVPRLCDRLDLKKESIRMDDGCELYVEEEGAGTPLVLLHGGPGATHHHFHPYFSRAKEFARIIYYDQRGCGISGYCPGQGYSVDQAADDLDRLRDALGIERWVVLGHSYGGFLAQYYALKYPARVSGLVLVGAVTGMHVAREPSREQEFISAEEKARMQAVRPELDRLVAEKKIPESKYHELLGYNWHLNGDWKRQNFSKPSAERIAQYALYEWKQDKDFNFIMSHDVNAKDLQGAFDGCPIPTLLMEGKWDLTWNTDKPGILQRNHPGARLVMFENSSHSPFGDEPEIFFSELKNFMADLPPVVPERLSAWKDALAEWRQSLPQIVYRAGWGRKSNETIAAHYSPDWLGKLDAPILPKVGYALYDAARYDDAAAIFQSAYEGLRSDPDQTQDSAVALIWLGFVRDLQGRRDEAVAVYKKVAMMNVSARVSHAQFGLEYAPSPYALEKIRTPFTRLENRQTD